ncbi:MAG: peptide deformylase [Bacteriovoracaceae bacterium]|jgi:peptide deformylase|nr:peptide deformylase [Bacteriovoracaceae bacterium]
MSAINLDLKDYILEGELLNIFKYPSPVLKKVADPVTDFNDDLKLLVKNMLFTMYKAPGIGLAAPQVGLSHRLFVLDVEFQREEIHNPDGDCEIRLSHFKPRVFINPIISDLEGEIIHEEGCLSVPGVYEDVKRAEKITINYQDLDGKSHKMEAEEMLAICLQHENDHLDGVVFLERLSLIKKNLLTKKYLKKKKRG